MNFLELASQYARGEIAANDERIKAAEDLLAEMAATEDGRQEIAETIGVYIDKTFNRFDIAPYICNYRNFNLGDKPEFRMKKKGIRAYWIADNSSTPKSRNVMETLTMEFETISARPECFIDELKAGRIQGFAELLGDTQEAIRNGIAAKVFELLTQVYNSTNTPEMYATFSGAITDTVIDKAIDTIFYKTGKSPVIIGDRMLIKQITKFDGYTDEAREEIRMTGMLGKYNGASLMALPEIKDEATGKIVVPKNRLYVVSSKIGYAGTYGDTKTGQETSIEDWSWNARIDKSWGMTVTDPNGMYVVEAA